MHSNIKSVTFFLTSVAFVFLSSGCGSGSHDSSWQKKEGLVWNTSYHITYNGRKELGDSVVAILDRVGKSLSVFDTTSLVSRVNSLESTRIDDDFIRVYSMSKKINEITEGAFDPTLSPLISAWGFGSSHKASPDTLHIDSILRYTGIGKTHIYGDSIFKDDIRIEFNFSAIAKGYGCDAIAEMLERNGVSDFLVEIGGEIMMKGRNPEGSAWRISIDRPILSNDREIHDSQEIISISDAGIATSGNYRNFHRSSSGETYGHTISAFTGRPVSTDVISATVVASSAMEADGFATAFMAMGNEKVKSVNSKLGLPVMLVLTDSTTCTSPRFKSMIQKK